MNGGVVTEQLIRMVPPFIGSEVTSNAERQIFRWLSQIAGSDWVAALHSVNLSEHRWKSMGEIDFLLVGPRGIYVLEVKGGRVARRAGVWEFTDRHGKTRRRREGPFDQARGAMFSLRDRIEELVPETKAATFGYAVLLPDGELAVENVEWDEAMLIDRPKLERHDGLRRGLGGMATYWTAKRSHPARMDRATIDRVVSVLRPDFETVVSLPSLARSIEQELIRLTTNQYRALDALAASARVIFEGGAGTGKTLLAAEACRRAAADGASVLYTCRSPYVAAQVRADRLMAPVAVDTVDRLTAPQVDRYDLLVVDEAQDVITYQDLDLLDRQLTGGLEDGRWLMFMDSNNQRGLVGGYDPEAMDFLGAIRPARFTLSDNCRNTREIVEETQRVTGADLGVATAGSGPAVAVIDGGGAEGAVGRVSEVLDELRDQGIDLGDVVLLSDRPFDESCFSRLPSRWRFLVDRLDLTDPLRRSTHRLGFAETSQFKGLESPFVIAETKGYGDESESRRSLYVAMTRARVGLWVVGREDGGTGEG